MAFLVQYGLVLLALGAWTGWAVAGQLARPDLFEKWGIREPRRLLQLHLDYVIMGVLVIAVGAVLPDLPAWIQVLIVFGTFVNPLLFLPMAFGPKAPSTLVFQLVAVASFVSVSVGLTGAAVVGVLS